MRDTTRCGWMLNGPDSAQRALRLHLSRQRETRLAPTIETIEFDLLLGGPLVPARKNRVAPTGRAMRHQGDRGTRGRRIPRDAQSELHLASAAGPAAITLERGGPGDGCIGLCAPVRRKRRKDQLAALTAGVTGELQRPSIRRRGNEIHRIERPRFLPNAPKRADEVAAPPRSMPRRSGRLEDPSATAAAHPVVRHPPRAQLRRWLFESTRLRVQHPIRGPARNRRGRRWGQGHLAREHNRSQGQDARSAITFRIARR